MTTSHSEGSTYGMDIICNGSGCLLERVGDRQPIQNILTPKGRGQPKWLFYGLVRLL